MFKEVEFRVISGNILNILTREYCGSCENFDKWNING